MWILLKIWNLLRNLSLLGAMPWDRFLSLNLLFFIHSCLWLNLISSLRLRMWLLNRFKFILHRRVKLLAHWNLTWRVAKYWLGKAIFNRHFMIISWYRISILFIHRLIKIYPCWFILKVEAALSVHFRAAETILNVIIWWHDFVKSRFIIFSKKLLS